MACALARLAAISADCCWFAARFTTSAGALSRYMPPPSGVAAPADPASPLPLLGGPLGAFACFMPLFALLFWPLRPPATSLLPPLPCVMAAMAVQVPRSVTYSTLVTPVLLD